MPFIANDFYAILSVSVCVKLRNAHFVTLFKKRKQSNLWLVVMRN